jgi:hypothetical protein
VSDKLKHAELVVPELNNNHAAYMPYPYRQSVVVDQATAQKIHQLSLCKTQLDQARNSVHTHQLSEV